MDSWWVVVLQSLMLMIRHGKLLKRLMLRMNQSKRRIQ